MLGTFGCVPAFDAYFRRGFDSYFEKGSGPSSFGPAALRKLGDFYNANAEIIEENRVQTLDFESGELTERRYTRAKVVDMIFWQRGADQARQAKGRSRHRA